MPFGLILRPLIFTKIITEVLKYLHIHKISASVYLDDFLLCNRSKDRLLFNKLSYKVRPHSELRQVSHSSFSHGHLSRGDVERPFLYSVTEHEKVQRLVDLVTGRDGLSYQCVGMPRSHQVPPHNQLATTHFHNDQVRQHYSSILHQQTGSNKSTLLNVLLKETQYLPCKRLVSPGSSHHMTS